MYSFSFGRSSELNFEWAQRVFDSIQLNFYNMRLGLKEADKSVTNPFNLWISVTESRSYLKTLMKYSNMAT